MPVSVPTPSMEPFFALSGSGSDFNLDSIMVKETGNGRIVVAGKTAADTLAAADQFIAGIKRQ